MTDPVYEKLKTDAAVILIELWRSIRHRAKGENPHHIRVASELKDNQPAGICVGRKETRSDGLCYFHLN